MSIYSFIPARLCSSRFPRKVLADIHGSSMLKLIHERAHSDLIHKTFITTCDLEIKEHAESFGAEVIMTSDKHERCLDRVAEAYSQLQSQDDSDIIICMQGDEPMIDSDILTYFIREFTSNNYKFAVTAVPISSELEFIDPDVVKIVWNEENRMVYTSRSPIPYQKEFNRDYAWKIFGLFAFRPSTLIDFNMCIPSLLEKIEMCDTNRICGLERIVQHVIPYKTTKIYQAVDNRNNIETVRSLLKK